VGFRYATLQVAKEFDVAGFATNLADGRVQVEVEGEKSVIDAFVAAVEERMHGFIRKVERSGQDRAPKFRGFTIR
jgi:acylphosphatase